MFKFGQKENKKIEDLIKLLSKNGKIMNLGCGIGGNSIFLFNKGFNVTTVDGDKEVINEIKKHYSSINAINKSILDFDFPKREYDLVLAINLLHFFKSEDIKLLIKEILNS